VEWLDRHDRRPTLGRQRADPIDRVERLALRLSSDDLARLVERLTRALVPAA
jgi:hypothetical protein